MRTKTLSLNHKGNSLSQQFCGIIQLILSMAMMNVGRTCCEMLLITMLACTVDLHLLPVFSWNLLQIVWSFYEEETLFIITAQTYRQSNSSCWWIVWNEVKVNKYIEVIFPRCQYSQAHSLAVDLKYLELRHNISVTPSIIIQPQLHQRQRHSPG